MLKTNLFLAAWLVSICPAAISAADTPSYKLSTIVEGRTSGACFDRLGRAEFYAVVTRHDQEIEDLIDQARQRVNRTRKEIKKLEDQIEPLLEQKKESERPPTEPLTEAQLQLVNSLRKQESDLTDQIGPLTRQAASISSLLSKLDPEEAKETDLGTVLTQISSQLTPLSKERGEVRKQLATLLEQQEESKRELTPPLSDAQVRQLRTLQEKSASLNEKRDDQQSEVSRLTRQIRLRVGYGGDSRRTLDVSPGDVVSVRLWEDDAFSDDFCGGIDVDLDRETLEQGRLNLLEEQVVLNFSKD